MDNEIFSSFQYRFQPLAQIILVVVFFLSIQLKIKKKLNGCGRWRRRREVNIVLFGDVWRGYVSSIIRN